MNKTFVLKIRKILIFLLILWMLIVFFLSNQKGTDSGALSHKLALILCFNNENKANEFEPILRKVAHMTEFGIGAMIFYGIVITYPKVQLKIKILLTISFIVLCAGLDEFHQSFINARNSSLLDVIIDFFGGALGTGAMYFLEIVVAITNNKIKEELEKNSN